MPAKRMTIDPYIIMGRNAIPLSKAPAPAIYMIMINATAMISQPSIRRNLTPLPLYDSFIVLGAGEVCWIDSFIESSLASGCRWVAVVVSWGCSSIAIIWDFLRFSIRYIITKADMIAAAEISRNSHSHIKLGYGEEPANIGPACIQGGCNK